MENIKVGSVQFNHVPGNKDANKGIMAGFINSASSKGIKLLVFPEMCITGYWHVRNLTKEGIGQLAEPVPSGPSTDWLLDFARKHGISIGAGLIEVADDGNYYNTYVVAMPDGKIARHRKLHCFISEYMASGSEYTVFDLPGYGKVGILICYDNNIIENVRITALMGAEILLSPHQTGGCKSPSPYCMGAIDLELWKSRKTNPEAIESEFRGPKGRDWLMRWLPARAHDNGMFLIFSNGVGIDDDEVRTGNAMILDPYGAVLAETWKAADEMIEADLDAELLKNCTGRRWIASRRPDLYEKLVESSGEEADIRKLRFNPIE